MNCVAGKSRSCSAGWTGPPPRRGSRSAALVELSLLLPILMLFFAALTGYGYVFTQVGIMLNAAREGARYGSANPLDLTGIKSCVVQEAAGAGANIETNNVTVTYPAGVVTSGSPIKVTVALNLAPLVDLGSFSVFSRLLISRDCTMVIK